MLCTVTAISIIISTKTATIICQSGQVLTQTQIITGNPKAKDKLDRTPVGRFVVDEVATDAEGYMRGAARFKSYETKANADGETTVGYYIHGNDKKLNQQWSIGCVRLDMGKFKFQVGTKVSISN